MDAGFWFMLIASIVIGGFVFYSYGAHRALDGLSSGGQLLRDMPEFLMIQRAWRHAMCTSEITVYDEIDILVLRHVCMALPSKSLTNSPNYTPL